MHWDQFPKLNYYLKDSVVSEFGNGCNLFADSYTIGKIESTKVSNTQLIVPTDKTLKPGSKVFSAVKLTDNYFVESINVLSGGSNYVSPPKIKLYNPKTDQIVSNFSASAILKNNSIETVEIVNPGNGLNSNDNKIITTDNTNGFSIINVSVAGASPYTVTLTLKTPEVGFTTSNPLPISIGDEIFIEEIASLGNGFNSSDYRYSTFTVTNVNPAYGSQDAATVTYQLNENPGSYDSDNTYKAFVIPYSYIPQFETVLKQNIFYNGENIHNTELIDNVNNNPITNVLKLKDSLGINENDILLGKLSRSKGTVIEVDTFTSFFTSDYSVSEVLGGVENRSHLSSNIQKLSDNDYYQKFSYSLKSKKSYENWNSPVSDTSHISGYKKFSDLSVESVGKFEQVTLSPTTTLNVILDSYVNVNCISDYDLVNEIDVEDNDYVYTEYLKFGRLKLGNSIKSTNNRVLSIDNISDKFNIQPIIPSILIDNTYNSDSIVLKYEFYLTATDSFFGEFVNPEIFEYFITKTSDTFNCVPYSNYFPFNVANPYLGTFSIDVNPTDLTQSSLTFTPKNQFLSVDIKSIKETAPNTVGIATTSFGYIKNVELCQTYSGIGSTVFYTISESDCIGGTLIIGISSIFNSIQKSFESSFINADDILISQYAENILNDLGSINIIKNSGNIEFTYSQASGIGVTISANLKLITNTYSGYDSLTKTFSKFSSSKITTNSSSTGISSVSGTYGFTKYILGVEQNTGVSTQKSIVQLNSIHSNDYLNNIIYDVNGTINLDDINFQTSYNISNNKYTLFFNPVTAADYTITIYEVSLLSPDQ